MVPPLRSSAEIAERRDAAVARAKAVALAKTAAHEAADAAHALAAVAADLADIAKMKAQQRAAAQTSFLAEGQGRRDLSASLPAEARWGAGDDGAPPTSSIASDGRLLLSHAPIATTARVRSKFHFGGKGSGPATQLASFFAQDSYSALL